MPRARVGDAMETGWRWAADIRKVMINLERKVEKVYQPRGREGHDLGAREELDPLEGRDQPPVEGESWGGSWEVNAGSGAAGRAHVAGPGCQVESKTGRGVAELGCGRERWLFLSGGEDFQIHGVVMRY